MRLEQARALTVGALVRVLCDGSGDVDYSDLPDTLAPPDGGEDRHYLPGTLGQVTALDQYGAPQGFAVTVVIIEGPARWVVNVFDEGDEDGYYPLEAVDPADWRAQAALEAFEALEGDGGRAIGAILRAARLASTIETSPGETALSITAEAALAGLRRALEAVYGDTRTGAVRLPAGDA